MLVSVRSTRHSFCPRWCEADQQYRHRHTADAGKKRARPDSYWIRMWSLTQGAPIVPVWIPERARDFRNDRSFQ